MKIFTRYIAPLLGLLLVGCGETGSGEPDFTENDQRTVLVYMVANNNLISDATDNIEEMLVGATRKSMEYGRMLVYYVPCAGGNSVFPNEGDKHILFEVVVNNKSGKSSKKVLKTYDRTNALDPTRVQSVIADTKNFASAKNYGIILWSHATGWFPADAIPIGGPRSASVNLWERRDPERPLTKSFGDDGNKKMEIDVLAQTLKGSDTYFEFILFDCCFMSSIEVWYELRETTKYIISSPSEIMAAGFSYRRLMSDVLGKIFSPKAVCQSYMEYYRNEADFNSAMISYVETSKLNALAQTMHEINTRAASGVVNINTIQTYEGMYRHLFYDLEQYVEQLCTDDVLYAKFKTQLDEAVLFEDHTLRVYSDFGSHSTFPVTKSCGVTTYIPSKILEDSYGYTTMHNKTAWAIAVGL